MRDVLVWLMFVLIGAVVLDLSRDHMNMSDVEPTEQLHALS